MHFWNNGNIFYLEKLTFRTFYGNYFKNINSKIPKIKKYKIQKIENSKIPKIENSKFQNSKNRKFQNSKIIL